MERPVVLMAESATTDEVLRLAAAVGCDLDRVADVTELRARWRTAPLVLLDTDAVEACAGEGFAHRSDVLLVANGPPPTPTAALRLGVQLVDLPSDTDELHALLADAADNPSPVRGRVLAVLGGRGGAGASVFAAAVAQEVLSSGGTGLLVDCDPFGGGLDLTLGAEGESGLRWPEVRVTGGRVRATALRAALPRRTAGTGSLTVLSCAREGTPTLTATAVGAVVDAGTRAGDTVVCDVPRHPTPPSTAVLDRADLVILLVPAEIRACAAARQLATHIRTRHPQARIRTVVRGPAPSGLTPHHVAEAVGVPLLTTMRPERHLPESLDQGHFPHRPRGPLSKAARLTLTALLTPL
ncbi:hypothetical protein GCM10022243_65880 [Saccharothrix violaceirubra]|uniref:Secretion/DNA translocation related CpaE-like protein n=1 Tax=Saccharothrix violaceirubra TaxID=413306 RepID=A0A7W7TBU8_9PSEU|nr:septum site-determining protein Ssd [Saccharothrix violaceirubra]MBB4968925.1 secretion/DNA translocation related CpaE-like protein [Saccharothrix violaceirubra]